MYLSKLEIVGFKSFAHKTILRFNDGITAVVGPNGCGKCVVGSAVVTLADGQAITIQELVQQALHTNNNRIQYDDGVAVLDTQGATRVLSLNPDTMRLEARPVTAFVRRTAPSTLLRVRTRSGREVTATPYHPLFSLNDGKLQAIHAEDLQPGLKIAIPRRLVQTSTANPELDLRKVLSAFTEEDRMYIPASSSLIEWGENASEVFGGVTGLSKHAKVKSNVVRGLVSGQAISTTALMKLEVATQSLAPVQPTVQSRQANGISLPAVFSPELARFLGLLIAEGRNTSANQVWFVNADSEINQDYANLARRLFGVTPFTSSYKPGTTDTLIFSKALCLLLERVFEFAVDANSFQKKAPKQLFSSGNVERWAFLSGLFEGDAYIKVPSAQDSPSQALIEYCTASKQLAQDVVGLLLRCGVFATIRAKSKYATNTQKKTKRIYYSVLIYGTKQLRYVASQLKFVGAKEEKLKVLRNLPEINNPNHDVVPESAQLVRKAIKQAGISVKAHRKGHAKLAAYNELRCQPSREGLLEVIDDIIQLGTISSSVQQQLHELQVLATSDIYWDEIISVDEIEPEDPWVYDLCVEETHNFIADNIIVHNSNVIDAIRWAIGEQKASVLRSDKMEEVIFNGAGKRRPLGMAEVSLTIENTKGILPTEYSEVVITRRLFRNGDSEYLLNKTQCRLRDIVDLFMDTGMGANAYSVIELKMIETILSDRADERRRLFEEAAGVTKYKARRREALRKLDATQADLLRVNDIVKEVAKKVAALERQAKKAEEYTTLDAERKRVEIEVLEREYATTMSRIAPLEERLAEAKSKRTELDSVLAQEETILRELEREQGEIETALLEAQKDLNAVTERIAIVEQRQAVSVERRRSLTSIMENSERDIKEAEGGIEVLMKEKGEVEALIERLAEQNRLAEAEYEAIRSEVMLNEAALAGRRTQAKRSQDRVIDVINRLAALRGEEERTRARIEVIRQRLDEFDEQDDEARLELEQIEEVLIALTAQLNQATAALDEAQRQFEEGQAEKGTLRTEIDDLRTQTIELHNGINSRKSKIDFLNGLVDQDESVRFLVQQPDWTPVERITVAESISTDEQYRTAVAAALGNAGRFLIVPSAEDALRGVQSLQSNRKGKATFVCLDRIPPTKPHPLPTGVQAIGWAADLCVSSPNFNHLRQHLLGGTLVVETLEQAFAASAHSMVQQAVTLDGVLIRNGGLIRGGGRTADEGITIGKREQIERLEKEVAKLIAQLDALTTTIAEKTEQHNAINLGALSNAIREAQQRVGNLEKQRGQAEYEQESANELLEAHDNDRTRAYEEIQRLEGLLEGTEPRRKELMAEQHAAEQTARELNAELERMEVGFADQSRQMNEKQVLLAGLRGDQRSARAELERMARDREHAERTIQRRRQERERAEEELGQLEGLLEEFSVQLESFRAELAEAQAKQEEIIQRQAAKREEIARHGETLREERRDYERSIEQMHELELKLGELKLKAESLVQRGRDELEIELTLKEFGDDDVKMGELRESLRQIKGRLKMMGSVNLLAYDEWREENERYQFLQGQLNDLKQAEDSLMKTIAEINETAQRKFVETFEQIRTNFQDIFRTLFLEGDEADLKIADGDPLEAQIEIIAKPRGKRPHSIDLLSGGEKTLTAIALLFSIYLVKPSPFCILDEVDAPLDDANIDRFVQLIKRFDNETQFIIVTHNKRTMGAADTMYGVTQEEDGVSKIVSVRFSETKKQETNNTVSQKEIA